MKTKSIGNMKLFCLFFVILFGAITILGSGSSGSKSKTWYRDSDNDGYGNPEDTIDKSSQPEGYVLDNTDCNDTDATIYPGATEIPGDGIDQNCDGWDLKTWYKDADEDGYGDINDSTTGILKPDSYVSSSTDCDDTDATINPGGTDIADDGIDQDCDGKYFKTWYIDADSDGYGDKSTSTQASDQPDGYVANNTDCNDENSGIHPGATEIYGDGTDQDCDGSDLKTFYLDADGDGYGDSSSTKEDITTPSGYVSDNTDCNDTDATIYPNAPEICGDGISQDCSGNDKNCLPVASIDSPSNNTSYAVGVPISFKGSGTDSNGSISAYEWNFGDESSSSDKNPSFTFYKDGTFTITLKVTDNDGDACETNASIDVNITRPTPEANSLGMTFIYIPAGSFVMGSPEDEYGRGDNETQHNVTLSKAFYMQSTEVTQQQWEAVKGTNPSSNASCSNCPVESVSWLDVQAFITTLNTQGMGTYRLPTEAEWEYCASTRKTSAFPNGDITSEGSGCIEDTNLDKIGWYCYNSGFLSFDGKPGEVAKKERNDWGLYDMNGNVWEWCQDYYDGTDYSTSDATDPTGPDTGDERVCRGGSWFHSPKVCRSSNRDGFSPDTASDTLGFRLIKEE